MMRSAVMSRRSHDITLLVGSSQYLDRTDDVRRTRKTGISGNERCPKQLSQCDITRVIRRTVVAKLPTASSALDAVRGELTSMRPAGTEEWRCSTRAWDVLSWRCPG
jgi:hypothetical protein